MSNPFSIVSQSPDHTRAIGVELGRRLRGGDVICLSGDLGAGKTWLTGGIAQGWDAQEPVHSPTFVFIHIHHHVSDPRKQLYHVDCYRLNSKADAESIGLEDLLNGDDVVILEWPERVIDLLPADRLWIDLDPDDSDPDARRVITFSAIGKRYETLLMELRVALTPR